MTQENAPESDDQSLLDQQALQASDHNYTDAIQSKKDILARDIEGLMVNMATAIDDHPEDVFISAATLHCKASALGGLDWKTKDYEDLISLALRAAQGAHAFLVSRVTMFDVIEVDPECDSEPDQQ